MGWHFFLIGRRKLIVRISNFIFVTLTPENKLLFKGE